MIAIKILDSNDAPTRIFINGSNVVMLEENSPVEAVVGHLSCLDQDVSQSHEYSLQSYGNIFMVRFCVQSLPIDRSVGMLIH